MPFNPRLLGPDDDDLPSLPCDLAGLAGRLEHEADLLAAKYPPARPGLPPLRTRNRRWLSAAGLAAAALLLITGGVGFKLSLRGVAGRAGQQLGAPLATAPASVLGRGAPLDPQSEVGFVSDEVAPGHNQPLRRRMVPTVLFHELSAPEQEAVLDLLEDHGDELLGLSI